MEALKKNNDQLKYQLEYEMKSLKIERDEIKEKFEKANKQLQNIEGILANSGKNFLFVSGARLKPNCELVDTLHSNILEMNVA